jgi:1,2-diacylglycerol 3-beta-galactosyltransferase
MQRILILMSNTGGGHRASALALQAGFEALHPNRFAIEIVDLLADYTVWPLTKASSIYPFLVNHAPWAWTLLYSTERHPRLSNVIIRFASFLTSAKIRRLFEEHRPDLIISVHPMMQHVPLGVLSKMQVEIPFVTVVTDLASTHPVWYHPQVDGCFVATEEAFQMALAAGLPSQRVHLSGLPVRPAFAQIYPAKHELRRQLELVEDLPTVLIMGGGDGMGPVEEIAIALAQNLAGDRKPVGQMVVICGRNELLTQKLTERRWMIPVQVKGFVNNMPEWMLASDCVVTKAGPGTIAEALICGLPMVISGFIPGQEEGNVNYVVDHRVGKFTTEPQEIGEIVRGWFSTGEVELTQMSQTALRLGHPQATFEIVQTIINLAERRAR